MTQVNEMSHINAMELIQGCLGNAPTPSETRDELPLEPFAMHLNLTLTSHRNSKSVQLFTTSLKEVLQDKQKYKAFLNLTGDNAQKAIDHLQKALGSPMYHNSDKAVAIKALTRLARRSGVYPDSLKIPELQLFDDKPIGEGSYGQVWKARLNNEVVCIKILRMDQHGTHQRLLKALLREGLIWAQFSCHSNITPFLGIRVGGIRKHNIGLVSQWMPNGNIVEYLKRYPGTSRMDLIHDIASGLQHLHTLSIVHGDIKGRNILIDLAGRACLADFGLANVLADNILNWSSLLK